LNRPKCDTAYFSCHPTQQDLKRVALAASETAGSMYPVPKRPTNEGELPSWPPRSLPFLICASIPTLLQPLRTGLGKISDSLPVSPMRFLCSDALPNRIPIPTQYLKHSMFKLLLAAVKALLRCRQLVYAAPTFLTQPTSPNCWLYTSSRLILHCHMLLQKANYGLDVHDA
jgi:hypothetical protein